MARIPILVGAALLTACAFPKMSFDESEVRGNGNGGNGGHGGSRASLAATAMNSSAAGNNGAAAQGGTDGAYSVTWGGSAASVTFVAANGGETVVSSNTTAGKQESTVGGTPPGPPSCQGLTAKCQGESCCRTIKVTGGTFLMGRSESGTDASSGGPSRETPEHNATVATFALDKYEVTVGRFRAFVNAYNPWRAAGNPKDNAGAHPIAANTGWGRSWTAATTDLPTDAAALATSLLTCGPPGARNETWMDSAATTGDSESYPINCVRWFVAFAFCIWDEGRLPTEAEWEYAAAGGNANRLYPWGNDAPDYSRANYGESLPIGTPFLAVGSKLSTGGTSAFGHADLAGSMYEWVFDYLSATYYGTVDNPVACGNCANADPSSTAFGIRATRGGSWGYPANHLRAAYRSDMPRKDPGYNIGLRCARTAQ